MTMTDTRITENTPSAQAAIEDEWYDLLPIEMKLIKYTLGLGLALLVIFVLIFKVF